jgi:hypothetical protein
MGTFMTNNILKCPEDADYDERDVEDVKYIVLFFKLLFVGCLLMIIIGSLSHASVQVHEDSHLMDSIRPAIVKYVPEYRGQVDRYDVSLLQNDPEVLVSLPKPKMSINPMKEPVERIVYVEKVPEEDIIVTTKFTCDTEREDCYAE